MVAMYQRGTSPSIQEIVLASLKDPNGKVRIIIATGALGMGVDIKGLHRIINSFCEQLLLCLFIYTFKSLKFRTETGSFGIVPIPACV